MKIHQFKAKDSEAKSYSLCLENISKCFVFDYMTKTGLNGKVCYFFVSYETIDVNDIYYIHKYLKKNTILHKFLNTYP